MTLNTSEVLDLSKENVQPLRQGRKAAHLKTALQAQTDPEMQYRLQKQREKFEFMIRMYEGDDPLEPYCAYVAWLEQSFTKLGRDSNLIPLIEDALMKFKDCDKYRQDQRFVQLLIKYINAQSNPLELYQLSYNQGLGTMCSALYKAWAEELDRCNDFKRADQIYQIGLQCRAQPLEELQNAHIQFQLSIARKMLEGNINNSEQNVENSRSALSKLPSKVKSSRTSKDSAGIFQLSNRDINRESKSNAIATGKFKVYQEDEPDGIIKSDFKNKNEKLPKGSVAERENIMKAGKWLGQKQRQTSASKLAAPTTPSFQIHEDPDAACDMVKTVIRPRALKLRREEFKCPVAVFEEPDPTKKPMYPKHLVYVGGRDIQLEELRAAMYWRKIEKLEQEKSRLRNEISLLETPHKPSPHRLNNQAELKPEQSNPNCEVDQQLVSYKINSEIPQDLAVTRSDEKIESRTEPLVHSTGETYQKNVLTEVKHYQNESLLADQICKKQETKTDHVHSIHETSQKNVSTEIDPLVGLFERGSGIPHYSPSTSFTVNTRAAMNVIQTMWASPLPPSTTKYSKPCNDFDDSVFKVPSRSPPNNRQVQKKLSFPVFCDEETKSSRSSEKSRFSVFCDETPVASTQKIQSPQIISVDKLTFPVFSDEMLATSTQNPQNTVMPPSELLFPVFAEEMPATSVERSISRATSNKPSFQVFANEPEISLQKPENSKSAVDRLAIPIFTDDVLATSTQKSENLNTPAAGKFSFPIFTEDGIMPLMGPKNDTNRNQFSEVNKLLFPVDNDDDDIPGSSVKNTEIRTPVQAENYSIPLIVPVNLADTPLEPENKENFPPKSYATPVERRPLSGILTPACNVPVNPIESEDSEDEEDYCRSIAKTNDFDDETCSTKAFAITLPSSTPFGRSRHISPRKSLLYNGSYISEENTAKSTTENSKYVNEQHLSLILENSKEQGSNSSGGSSATNK